MNRIIIKIINISILVCCIWLISCEDIQFGNDFLEKPNSDEIPIDSVFSKKIYADQAMNQFYKSLYDYMSSLRGYHAEAHTLECYSDLGYTSLLSWNHGSISASSNVIYLPFQLSNGEIMGDPSYGIRKAYLYIENVDKVTDMSDNEKKIRKAEAKVIIGMHYAQMIRYYGSTPWIDHAYSPNEIFKFPRLTLEEIVNRTCNLLDEAAKDLPWYTTNDEYGHMTAAAAKAIKFRLLLFVASPLFNNEKPYLDGEAAQLHLSWYGDYKKERWIKALNAGLDFLRLNRENGNYYRIENTGKPQEDYVTGYFVKGSREVVMASFRWATYNNGIRPFKSYESGYGGAPRGSYADMFQWKDGSEFDWNNVEHRSHPFFDENGNPTRDVRIYETLVINGDKWQGRKAEVYQGGREGFGPGSKVAKWTMYGYGFRKFIRDKHNEMQNKPYSCPLFRMPELYLSMAEIMNQLNMAEVKDEFGSDAYDYLNIVRNRAGMPDVTPTHVLPGNQLWKYLLDERAREFGQEEIRYFDVIRYKKGEWFTRPMEMLETKKIGNKFEYTPIIRDDIKYLWKDHWYLLPYPNYEINKKYGLIQNPGW